MDGRKQEWSERAEAIWFAETFPYVEATRLAADVAQDAGASPTAMRAREALPSLRRAAASGADSYRRSVARRLFGFLRNELHQSSRPAFGKRGASPPRTEGSSGDHAHRNALDLPIDGPVSGPDVMAAYRRKAKLLHPDRGGSPEEFRRLVAARDALLGRG